MNLWSKAPFRIEYGHMPNGKVIIGVALDKDHTLTLVCEEDQLHLVNIALEKFIKGNNVPS